MQNYREGEIDCENKYGSNKKNLDLKKLVKEIEGLNILHRSIQVFLILILVLINHIKI